MNKPNDVKRIYFDIESCTLSIKSSNDNLSMTLEDLIIHKVNLYLMEIKQLKRTIKSMRNCSNCQHSGELNNCRLKDRTCWDSEDLPDWCLKEVK